MSGRCTMTTESNSTELPTFELPVERSAALMRAVWRLLIVTIIAIVLLSIRPDWRLLWLTDRASLVGLGVIWTGMLLTTAMLAYSAGRWITLAVWRRPVGIRVSPEAIELRLGPFGERRYAWKDIRVSLPESVDAELISSMPDDAFVPQLRHPAQEEDLAILMLRFSRTRPEALTRLLRPYMALGMQRSRHGN